LIIKNHGTDNKEVTLKCRDNLLAFSVAFEQAFSTFESDLPIFAVSTGNDYL
jgi:hypothetical protein